MYCTADDFYGALEYLHGRIHLGSQCFASIRFLCMF